MSDRSAFCVDPEERLFPEPPFHTSGIKLAPAQLRVARRLPQPPRAGTDHRDAGASCPVPRRAGARSPGPVSLPRSGRPRARAQPRRACQSVGSAPSFGYRHVYLTDLGQGSGGGEDGGGDCWSPGKPQGQTRIGPGPQPGASALRRARPAPITRMKESGS